MRKVLLAIVCGALLLSGCATSESAPTSAPKASPTNKVTDENEDHSEPREKEETGPGQEMQIGVPFLPGKYHTIKFHPQVVLSAPVDATPLSPEAVMKDIVLLNSSTGSIEFTRPKTVFDPFKKKSVPLPKDLVAWFQSHPLFEVVSGPTSVRFAGREATRLELLGVGFVKNPPRDCWEQCLPISVFGTDLLAFGKGVRVSVIVVELKDGPMIVSMDSDAGVYKEFRESAERVLKTVKI